MKTSNMRRALSVTLTGLALAAITQIGYAGRDVASETEMGGRADASQLAPAPAMAEPRRTARGSPVTLYIEDTSGRPFRLVHDQGTGWRYVEGWKSPSAAASLFRKVAFGSTTPAPAKGATPDGEPQTVFIDGPTGFTFVWDRDSGWKFVGKIADKSS